MMRDLFFYSLDKALPRSLAAVPYSMALKSLQSVLVDKSTVWARNSFKRGNYIFGVSDLDISILIKADQLKNLAIFQDELKKSKSLYPFLGETNFYVEEALARFAPSLNTFEGSRDPILLGRVGHKPFLNTEKIVFLLRMLYSDRTKLNRMPFLRQRKWKIHLSDMGEKISGDISYKDIFEIIINSIGEQNDKVREVLEFLIRTDVTEESIFKMNVPHLWKYLFPHKYLWFDKGRPFDESLDDGIFRDICLKQIDWEIWGLFSQLIFLNPSDIGFSLHMNRLKELAIILEDNSGIAERCDELLSFRSSFYNIK
jgi:hypothetical protein